MLNTEAKNLLDKFLSGDPSISTIDIIEMQTSKKRLPAKSWQCNYCVYRDCIYNNTREEDIPEENTPEDWKLFHKFEGCYGCKNYEKI